MLSRWVLAKLYTLSKVTSLGTSIQLDEIPLQTFFQLPLTCVVSLLSLIYSLVCSGGLRLKRDITEYAEFVRSFNAPTVDEKFELLGM